MGTREASLLLGISRQRLLVLLAQGRVKDADKNGRFWEIPVSENGMPVIIPARRGPKGIWHKEKPKEPKMIHVNQSKIKGNKGKPPEKLKPVLSVKDGDRNDYGYELYIPGPCQIVYEPYKPAKCGAHLWINTYEPVQFIHNEFNQDPARQPSKQIFI
ncbi:MAG: hypothetical protein F6K40_27605 [Okeania sp. SIO3I5]|uniref:hypothetical protein n=1 Tax=Okeania sp. SIO3I5 TaxID=2607805 RepID=UPI0013BB3174|nr:hypothetical protein [Okeania sp. SIO3I5]NEQ39812.1 hypothetical protein [Okeania sp. SIO3I5]